MSPSRSSIFAALSLGFLLAGFVSPPLTCKQAWERAAVTEGDACPASQRAVRFEVQSQQGGVVRGHVHGGGCSVPSFAAVYERGSSPLRVRLCAPSTGTCRMAYRAPVSVDLTGPLAASHASAVQWVP